MKIEHINKVSDVIRKSVMRCYPEIEISNLVSLLMDMTDLDHRFLHYYCEIQNIEIYSFENPVYQHFISKRVTFQEKSKTEINDWDLKYAKSEIVKITSHNRKISHAKKICKCIFKTLHKKNLSSKYKLLGGDYAFSLILIELGMLIDARFVDDYLFIDNRQIVEDRIIWGEICSKNNLWSLSDVFKSFPEWNVLCQSCEIVDSKNTEQVVYDAFDFFYKKTGRFYRVDPVSNLSKKVREWDIENRILNSK